ncbi:MAG TPA: hypothetical protein VMU06_13050, partial [Stellaceae bacterium]|nr:hypothetical protein [Stellaceae bacterium]
KAAAELRQLRKDLMDHYGYSAAEVDFIPNHRNIDVARDALAFRKQQAEAKKQQDAAARKKSEHDAVERKRLGAKDMKEKLAKARGNFGARAEIIADALERE